ncbi:hypothetical protein VTN96DRAFT_7391 [Rasamsonia emersonii]
MRRKKEGGCWEGWWECGGRNGDREGESEKRRKSTVRRVWVVVVEQRVKSRDSSWAVPRVWEPSLPEAATGHSLAARQSPHASRPRANENPASRGSRRIYTNFSIVRVLPLLLPSTASTILVDWHSSNCARCGNLVLSSACIVVAVTSYFSVKDLPLT